MTKGNSIYSWGNMGSMDSGVLTAADGVQIPMHKINQLPNSLGPIEQYTSEEIEELLNERRENDRAADFTRLNVDMKGDSPLQNPLATAPASVWGSELPVAHPSPLPYLSAPVAPKLSALSVDDIWENIIEAQDKLRKYYLELGGRRIPGAGKWLMDNVSYINSSQMEGIAIRNGFAPGPSVTE